MSYTEADFKHYEKARALYPVDVLAWVQSTAPQASETLRKKHGAHASETVHHITKRASD